MNELAQLIDFSNSHSVLKQFANTRGLGKTVMINSDKVHIILPFTVTCFLFNCTFTIQEIDNPFSNFSCPYNFILQHIDHIDTIVVDNPKEVRYVVSKYIDKIKNCILVSNTIDISEIKEMTGITIYDIPFFHCIIQASIVEKEN